MAGYIVFCDGITPEPYIRAGRITHLIESDRFFRDLGLAGLIGPRTGW